MNFETYWLVSGIFMGVITFISTSYLCYKKSNDLEDFIFGCFEDEIPNLVIIIVPTFLCSGFGFIFLPVIIIISLIIGILYVLGKYIYPPIERLFKQKDKIKELEKQLQEIKDWS